MVSRFTPADGRGIGVQLTLHEVHFAASAGIRRRLAALSRRLPGAHGVGSDEAPWSLDVEGACAELAVAKHLGIYWNGTVGELHLPDVGALQVRSTPRADGRLIVHPGESGVFVLVTGQAPRHVLRGWLPAEQAQQPRYWWEGSGRPAYFVPQGDLRGVGELNPEGAAG